MGLIDTEYLSEIEKSEFTIYVRKEIREKLQDISFPNSDIKLRECFTDKYDTTVLKFYGGLNGCGNWTNYFNDLGRLISYLESKDIHLWLIQIDNDCLDDVFTAYFGCKL